MLRYTVNDFIHQQIELSLNANAPNDFAPIQVKGDADFAERVLMMLENSHGVSSQMLDPKSASPIDLDAALHSLQFREFQIELVEGAELVESQPDISIKDS